MSNAHLFPTSIVKKTEMIKKSNVNLTKVFLNTLNTCLKVINIRAKH